MFITRKQLEEEKAKAVREFEERQWARDRFDMLDKRLHELDERLRRLEYPQDKTCDVEGVTNGLQ